MCGLIGFLSSDSRAADAAPAIEQALTCMQHRGPDEGGVWHDDQAAIGFRRLSIIDIEHSHQPLPYLDGRYQLIFRAPSGSGYWAMPAQRGNIFTEYREDKLRTVGSAMYSRNGGVSWSYWPTSWSGNDRSWSLPAFLTLADA